MPSPRADLIARNYRLRLRAMREEMARRVAAAYAAKLRQEEIRASYAAFVPIAARTITAAQGGAQTLTRAYIRGVGGYDPAPAPSLAGTSKAGTITEALTVMMPFILIAISKGSTPPEALKIGAGHVDQMADNELTRVVDAELDRQVTGRRAIGWTGIVNAPCSACAGNAGDHTFDEEIFRHPNCQCDRGLIFEDFSYTVPVLAPA